MILDRSDKAKCLKCPNLTTFKTGICEACRTITCKCGERFAPRKLGVKQCPRCAGAERKRKRKAGYE